VLSRTFETLKKILMDKGSSFKNNAMKIIRKNMGANVAPGTHQAKCITERTIQEVNRRMNVIGPQEWMAWNKHIKDVQLSI